MESVDKEDLKGENNVNEENLCIPQVLQSSTGIFLIRAFLTGVDLRKSQFQEECLRENIIAQKKRCQHRSVQRTVTSCWEWMALTEELSGGWCVTLVGH